MLLHSGEPSSSSWWWWRRRRRGDTRASKSAKSFGFIKSFEGYWSEQYLSFLAKVSRVGGTERSSVMFIYTKISNGKLLYQQELSTSSCLARLARLRRLKEFSDYLESSLHELCQISTRGSLRRASAYQITSTALGRQAHTFYAVTEFQTRLPCTRSPVLLAFSRHGKAYRICGSDNVNHARKNAYTIFWRPCGWHPPFNPANLK